MEPIRNILDGFVLRVFKSRDVTTPAKAWQAAGWDFFVPVDLHLSDFAKSYKAYLDDKVVYDFGFGNNYQYEIPITFVMKNPETGTTSKVRLVLVKRNDIDLQFDIKTENGCHWIGETADPEVKEILGCVIDKMILDGHAHINIPSGVHVDLPDNVFLIAENKSGVSSKRRLNRLACVTGNTLILTNKGEFPAQSLTKEFCDVNEILVKTYNIVTKEFEFRKCDGFKRTAEKDCCEVTFANETKITASTDHAILVNDKWYTLEYYADKNVIRKHYVGVKQVYSTNVETTGNYVSEGDIINKNCVIDSDYEGEIHLNLVNESDLPVEINAGEKIIQLVPMFQPQMSQVEVFTSKEEMYKNKKSNRGAGGFGSSGEK